LIEDAGVIAGDEQLDLVAYVPYKNAAHDLLKSAIEEKYKSMVQMRGRLCSFIVRITFLPQWMAMKAL
jgi:hypothetical protein